MATAAVALVLTAACGSTRTRGTHDPPARSLAAKCGDTSGFRGHALWLHAVDAQRLYSVDGGSGATAVVLVPESPPGDVCGWLPYMTTLQRAGLHVLAFDYRGTGDSPVAAGRDRYAFGRDLAAAVSRVRAGGAHRVVLLGASFGGVVVMQNGSTLHADAIVSLSGETRLPEYHVDALGAVPRLHVPLLIVGTRSDSYLPVPDAKKLIRGAASNQKRLVLFAGSWHGWEIVEDAPYAARARALILAWIDAHA